MKRLLTIITVLLISTSLLFSADTENNKISIGADIGIISQGVSVRYDSGRWFEAESSFRMPLSMYVSEGIEAISDSAKEFDPYSILSPELSITGYVTPLQLGSFSLGLGLNGSAAFYSNGPHTENETSYNAGTVFFLSLKPALKMQFDFSKWGFSITGLYPVASYGINIGDPSLGSALTGVFSTIYGAVRMAFDFKL